MPAHVSNNRHYWNQVLFEFFLVCLAFVLAFSIASYLNFSDQFYRWAMQYEDTLDIDELPLALLVFFAGLLWFAHRRMQESSQLIQKNHRLLQRVLQVQETERKRLAQDLHDELGQYLNAIKVQATSLLSDPHCSTDTRKTTGLIVHTAEHGYQSARHLMQSLRPVALDAFGLTAALEQLIETWRNTQKPSEDTETHTHYSLQINGDIDDLDEASNIAIFRIMQEALTNIAKHAKASKASFVLNKSPTTLTLTIRDNGVGFKEQTNPSAYGLLGMQERTESLNGRFFMNSLPGQGTTIQLNLPTNI